MKFPKITTLALRRQLLLQAVGLVLLALTIAGALLFAVDRARARQGLQDELASLASLLANRSAAAMAFLDEGTANENLAALHGLGQIGQACLFDVDGKVFARYLRPGVLLPPCAPQRPLDQAWAQASQAFSVQQPIRIGDQQLGALLLVTPPDPLATRLQAQLLVLLAALGAALAAALLLAPRLARHIAQPIAEVRDVSQAVIASGDFSLRAPDLGGSEVGDLGRAFNAMLDTISAQNRDLAARESHARRLFYDSPIPQLLLDRSLNVYVDCNSAAAEVHGYATGHDLVGKSPREVSAPLQADGQPLDSAYAAMLALDTVDANGAREWRYRRPDGVEWDGLVSTIDYSLGELNLVHISIQDMTERNRSQAELHRLNSTLESRVKQRTDELVRAEKLASLGALVAGVAHELNTPIGNALMMTSTLAARQQALVQAFAQGLRRASLVDFLKEAGECTDVLARNLHRAAELIGSFKQLSADQSSSQRRQFALPDLVHGVILALSPTLRRGNVRVVVELAPDLLLDSYPGPLSQVLENLLTNAVVHAFAGQAAGRILLRAEAGGAGRVLLTVSDDGCGMSAEVLRHVYDPFFTTRLGKGGSGLGMHIVYTLVTGLLGGRVSVSSEPGVGTQFSVDLPLVAPQAEAVDKSV